MHPHLTRTMAQCRGDTQVHITTKSAIGKIKMIGFVMTLPLIVFSARWPVMKSSFHVDVRVMFMMLASTMGTLGSLRSHVVRVRPQVA